jgi:hypothetical protein
MQILAGAQYIKINLPKMSISQNLNLQPLAQNLSQVNNYLYIDSYQINKKNEWINIFLHFKFAQNELEVRNKSLCDYLSVSQNNFKFLSASGNMKILSSASSHPEISPKPPSRTEMDALSCRGDSGEVTAIW